MPPTKQELVYDTIRERILTGKYGPGYRVVIDTIADEFKMSQLPVREAIRRLEAEGLIVFRPNAGAHVTPVDPRAFAEEVTVLAVLDGYCTALAAPFLGEAGIARLTAINAQMVMAMRDMDPLTFGRLNQSFHDAIYACCPNAALARMLHDVARRLDAVRRTWFAHIPYRGSAAVAEHRELIALIASNAPAPRVEKAARMHKLRTAETLRTLSDDHTGVDR